MQLHCSDSPEASAAFASTPGRVVTGVDQILAASQEVKSPQSCEQLLAASSASGFLTPLQTASHNNMEPLVESS